KQATAISWLPLTVILANNQTFDIREFAGGFYISGNDFAETTDLCASVILLKKPGDRMTYFFSRYWIPESKLDSSPDDVDYRQWERDGYLTIVPGNAVDTSAVADWHYYLLQEYDLKPVRSGYDNRYAKDYVKRYEDIFGEKIAVNIPQDFKVLSNPMKTLEADFRSGLVSYRNNPVDLWCYRNAGVAVDKFGRQMPCKMEAKKRIDGAAAAIIAYAALEWHKSEFSALVG
ncbi:MAG TPA: terminase TerL endonuclease subunit, partial [Dissulfurispiraceae bacterium]|nr:terminase TerL endonuclease subunit [Dissulfurispiraceae bacterium]